MTRPGRPSKLTPERASRIRAAVAGGAFATVAARAGGISGATYRAWMARGRDAERDGDGSAVNEADLPYVEFHESIREAEAKAEVAAVALIQQAARRGEWRAAAWFLERKHSDRWGRRDHLRQELSGPGGGPVHVDAKAELFALLGARRHAGLAPVADDSVGGAG